MRTESGRTADLARLRTGALLDRLAAFATRNERMHGHFEPLAEERDYWISKNRFFYESDWRYLQFVIPASARVLDLGCGTGQLLARLRPAYGVGVDISPSMVDQARAAHPDLTFVCGSAEDPACLAGLQGPFDYIVLSDTMGFLTDCQATLESLHPLCHPGTRIVIAYYSHLWEPVLTLAERLGQKMPQPSLNWLSSDDTAGLLQLADYEVVRREWRQLLPKRLLGLGHLINRFVGTLPFARHFCLRHYLVARSLRAVAPPPRSVSIVVPCRNEKGNIEDAIRRTPPFCDDIEFVFVEGNSTDGTYEECLRVQAAYPDRDIKVMKQDGRGKGDAVRKGFAAARGDVLMILDADLTVPPEALPKFFVAIASGKAEFVNGTRLVYPFEKGAMRFLNFLANRAFASIFSWLLNQRFTDTLCGTKVLRRDDYQEIVANRGYFGEFDPFGDFDLIFGAAKLNLKITEVPIRYADRRYGETNISRFRHGWLLLRMVAFAFRKMKVA
jgi:SAM-dependent methyltransferase